MDLFVSLIPVTMMLGLSLAWSKLFSKATYFNATATTLLALIGINILLTLLIQGSMLFPILQAVVGTVLFLLLIFFLGAKASSETIFVLVGVVALAPFPNGLLLAGIVFVLYTAWLVYRSAKATKRNLNSIALDVGLTTGVLEQRLPDFQELPDRATVTEPVSRITAAFAVPFVVYLAYAAVIALV